MSDSGEKQPENFEMVGADALRSNGSRAASRRDVLNVLVGAGVSITAAGTLTSLARSAQAEAPRRGGRIKVATSQSSATETLDPAKGVSDTDWSRAKMFYNGLAVLDETMMPQLVLAEEIAPSEGATVWNIKLRRDVSFHDGSPLTSADVVYSLRRVKDPALGSGLRRFTEQMQEITATGPHEVRIRLSGPNADFPIVLAGGAAVGFLIVKDGATDFRVANGTGPYKCREFQPGVRSIGVRNSEYFMPAKPYLDEIELFGITDESARINALLSGDVHLINAVNARSVERVTSAPNFVVFETKGGWYKGLVLRQDQRPGSSPDFVLAMKYLLDREQIRRAVYRNYAVIGNDQPLYPDNRFYDRSLPQRQFDLDKARFHLQRSGFANETFPIVVSPAVTDSEETAVLVQQAGRKIGLNLKLQRVPADGYWSSHWMKHPIFFGWSLPTPTADITFGGLQSQAPWNEGAFRNERFDSLLLEARAETDFNKRFTMYAEMQRLLHDGWGVCLSTFCSALGAHVSNLKGLRSNPLGGMMAYNFAENVWLEQ